MSPAPITDQLMFLAVDPGKATGFSGWAPATDSFFTMEIEGRHHFYSAFEAAVAAGWRLETVVERYTINAKTSTKTAQYDALYVIGHLDALCHKLGIPMGLQTVGEATDFATDRKLQCLGWYRPTKGQHSNMASRHLLTYLSKRHAHGLALPLLMKLATLGDA